MADMIDSLIVEKRASDDPKTLKHEDQFISRFGSRFSLSLDLSGREKAIFPMGLGPVGGEMPIFLVVSEGGQTTSLPMHYPVFDKTTAPVFDADFRRTMTTATADIGTHGNLRIEWRFESPFYPQDYRLSCGPFFYITARLTNVSNKDVSGRVLAGLEMEVADLDRFRGVLKRTSFSVTFRPPEFKPGNTFDLSLALVPAGSDSDRVRFDTTCANWECVAQSFSLKPGEVAERTFVLAYWHEDDTVVTYHGEPCSLRYQSLFTGIEDVLQYALDNRADIIRRSRLFDSLVQDASLTDAQKYFIPRNFHVYLGSTWMLSRPNGQELFLSYEGGTGYFATIDVEYNLALFYALLWPQCLTSEIGAWSDTYRRGNRIRPFSFGPKHRIMEHDIGGGFVIDEQIYIPGPMPVEENANFLLLNYLYWKFTGDIEVFKACSDICEDLADYIVDSDTNGNGLPDVGVTNTLDCFISLFHEMGDQVYLGLKAAGGLTCYVDLLEAAGLGSLAPKYRERADQIFNTVEEQCWSEDHYVVTVHETRPQGWDQATPLTLNGIAYLLFTGKVIPLDPARVRTDIATSAHDHTIWPSMGIWRDLIGLYYGLRPSREYDFRPDFRNDYYPRNFDSLGLILAGGGIGIDIPNAAFTYNPALSGRFPLPMLADWEQESIPWVEIKDGTALVESSDITLTPLRQPQGS